MGYGLSNIGHIDGLVQKRRNSTAVAMDVFLTLTYRYENDIVYLKYIAQCKIQSLTAYKKIAKTIILHVRRVNNEIQVRLIPFCIPNICLIPFCIPNKDT